MNEELYIRFENYINNQLGENEKLDLENLIQNDTEICQKFEIYKNWTNYLENKFDSKTIDFKDNLKAISKKHFENDTIKTKKVTKVISFKSFYYAIAASVAIAVGTWFMMQGTPEYNDFNQHENAYFTERGSIIKNLRLAQTAFNQKDYKEAIENFEIVLMEYDNPEVRFFYGISLLEEDQFVESETNFTNLQKGTSIYKDKATWYLALSKLKQKQFEECKNYLKKIPKEAEDYAKAQKLLNKLD